MRIPALAVFVLACSIMAANIARADQLAEWAARIDRMGPVYVEGRLRHYRVPANVDPENRENWQVRAEVCPTIEFKIWLKRPQFRAYRKKILQDSSPPAFDISHYAWQGAKFHTGITIPGEDRIRDVSIHDSPRIGMLWLEHYLTPLEYQFFDYPVEDAIRKLADRPHVITGNTISIELIAADENSQTAGWFGTAELDPLRDHVPLRMSMEIRESSQVRAIEWTMKTLETRDIAGMHMISAAQLTLYNPNILSDERSVRLWEAHIIRRDPIPAADFELPIPPGTPVADYTTHTRWTAGSDAASQAIDLATEDRIRQSLQAQLQALEIRAKRHLAITRIVVGALGVTLLISILAWRLRR